MIKNEADSEPRTRDSEDVGGALTAPLKLLGQYRVVSNQIECRPGEQCFLSPGLPGFTTWIVETSTIMNVEHVTVIFTNGQEGKEDSAWKLSEMLHHGDLGYSCD